MTNRLAARPMSFAEFYPHYLVHHGERVCRHLHFAGSVMVVACLAIFFCTAHLRWLLFAPVVGYGLAWIGHYGFARNRPATFSRPLQSSAALWLMNWQLLTGRITFRGDVARARPAAR